MPDGKDDSDFVSYSLCSSDGLPLRLRRRYTKGRPVLLLHGASASSDTFLTPRPGPGRGPNLVDYLARRDFEPWLLDWRSSKYVADDVRTQSGSDDRNRFNFDQAAERDIPLALETISKECGSAEIRAVGFCMGGGILAQAVLRDLDGVRSRLSHIVLMSLGLYYSMSLYGRLKGETRLLERVVREDTERRFLDPRTCPKTRKPRVQWPDLLEELYGLWSSPYDKERMEAEQIAAGDRYVLDMFNRVSFMFGEPYLVANLLPEIHETTLTLQINAITAGRSFPIGIRVCAADDKKIEGRLAYPFTGDQQNGQMVLHRLQGEFRKGQRLLADGQLVGKVAAEPVESPPLLPELFGAMNLHLHIHGAENLRAGQATRLLPDPGDAPVPHITGDAADYRGFDRLKRTVLIGGGLNRLWHRDSIDRMAIWLGRNPGVGRETFAKHILPEFGHQDLLWGRDSAEKVFPLIAEELGK